MLVVSEGEMWIGIQNLKGVECRDFQCGDELNWIDGTPASAFSIMPHWVNVNPLFCG